MNPVDWDEVEEQFIKLPLHDQLLLIERLVRRMRQGAFIDPDVFEREMEKMANDPAIQRELRMLPHPSEGPSRGRSEGGV
jgi:hypothetical protein